MAKKNIPGQDRLIGTVVPVGALRSSKSAGVGEFLDLVSFADLCVDMGIKLIQILPVNDTGDQSSSYFALTAFALHPLYIRLSALEEAAPFSGEIDALREKFDAASRFPYNQVLKAKMELLQKIYRANIDNIKKNAGLIAWIEANPWVKAYAVYRRIKTANEERSWKEWEQYREVSAEDITALWNDPALKGEHFFWAWLQQALDRQFSQAAQAIRGKGIMLQGDIPILMNEDSCDVWSNPGIFHGDLSAGVPPDMYSPTGQNWGFPIYNWEAQERDNYSWWRARLKAAEKYYDAYRIDHVLGFFRIWASSRADNSSMLGRYIPYVPVTRQELEELEFDAERIRWFSVPHVPTGEVWDGIRNNHSGSCPEEEIAAEAAQVFDRALNRIAGEELWLFKENIQGEKDISALGLSSAAETALLSAWYNRLFIEYEEGNFFPVWYYHDSRAYASLSETEREGMEELLLEHSTVSEAIWEKEGSKLLSVLSESSSMLPCAEDLGAVPECVPLVLSRLHILGLRVIRWFRSWDKKDQPYIPFEEYPELSVCATSVHDSSTLREWWDTEADQEYFAGFIGVPSLPKVYNPGTAKIILKNAAAAASRFRVFQIQDLLHLSQKWYARDPAQERINVPGTVNDFNWTYRLPASIDEIRKDTDLLQSVRELAEVKPEKGK
ncbi:MAG: 4-alpha-glucanotransferase [Spirochaetaceae bacterium]|jgi:4-alpha-glucanotransferase|nr:4-alpha-glucanotransferase [Spirochaetaceae bacterium]